MNTLLPFASDYMEGAYPAILERLTAINTIPQDGYGTDGISEEARQKILEACHCPEGEVYFLSGGTQTNAVIIDAILRRYEGVIAASTGHVSIHEAGAIEYTGHKVIELPQYQGKLSASDVARSSNGNLSDASKDHLVQPGMVYISQPTEIRQRCTPNRNWQNFPMSAKNTTSPSTSTEPAWPTPWRRRKTTSP